MRRITWIAAIVVGIGCSGTESQQATPAPDEGTGEVVEEPNMMMTPDPCVEQDICPDTDPGGAGGAGGANGGSGGMAGSGGSVTAAGPYAVGDKALVRKYIPLRKAPDANSDIYTMIPPNGGINDTSHPGMPLGYLAPGQTVTIVDPIKNNSYYKVTYQGTTGWVHGYKIVRIDPNLHPIDYAMQEDVRPGFFKRQVYHGLLNKDGPSSSGTCAPTSLAMALRIFGKEPAGLSIEESIHRVRKTYGDNSDSDGTLRSEIHTAAEKLGMSVVELATSLTPAEEMDRLDTQLDKRRVIQFEGIPGKAYRAAYTAAYKTAGEGEYTYVGRHSILVVGRQADGQYVVADPLSRVGMILLTRAELKSFITDPNVNASNFGGTGNAVWVPQK